MSFCDSLAHQIMLLLRRDLHIDALFITNNDITTSKLKVRNLITLLQFITLLIQS